MKQKGGGWYRPKKKYLSVPTNRHSQKGRGKYYRMPGEMHPIFMAVKEDRKAKTILQTNSFVGKRRIKGSIVSY